MDVPRRRIRSSAGASAIVAECESYLAGRYAQHLQSVGRTVPFWAWLNPLAHGSAPELRSLAAGHGVRPGDPASAAVRFLAGELLARTENDAGLAVRQRDVLVPEELALASRGAAPLSIGDLVIRVLAHLDRYDKETRQGHRGREAA